MVSETGTSGEFNQTQKGGADWPTPDLKLVLWKSKCTSYYWLSFPLGCRLLETNTYFGYESIADVGKHPSLLHCIFIQRFNAKFGQEERDFINFFPLFFLLD